MPDTSRLAHGGGTRGVVFEQLITPRLRQRNPESRTEALNQLRQLDVLGAKLRAALMRTALRHHLAG